MHIALSFSRYNASMHMLLSAPEYTRVQYKSFRETAHVSNPLAPITVGYELKILIKIASNKEFGSLQRNEHECPWYGLCIPLHAAWQLRRVVRDSNRRS